MPNESFPPQCRETWGNDLNTNMYPLAKMQREIRETKRERETKKQRQTGSHGNEVKKRPYYRDADEE
jgi:hypothetical protein